MQGHRPDGRSDALENLIALWASLDSRRRFIVVGATVAVILAVLGLSRMANTPNMSLLYSGLDGATAGEVIAALDQRGAIYEVRGDSIHVDAAQRDALRMSLAGDGLPATGAGGYELLDGLSGFGTTSQMFDAAYWRAKEGELARTILANPQIKAARVHIAQAPAQPFRQNAKASASVTVSTRNGTLPIVQAKALKHLIAAAVAGMAPEDVSVIDSVAGLILVGDESEVPDGSGDDRAAAMRSNVERLLEARVGLGKAVVEVSLDVVTEREKVNEHIFDPQSKFAISTETNEISSSSTETSDSVTVASNLPEGDAGAGSGGKSQSNETRELTNFEVSETQRELIKMPGAIRKLSVAVLVDGMMVSGTDGTSTWQPRSDEEMAVLRELVASAVGLDETRGDVLTLKSLAFEPVPDGGTLVEAGLFAPMGPIDIMSLLQMAVLTLVTLILGIFVLRPILSSKASQNAAIDNSQPLALPPSEGQTLTAERGEDGFRVLTGEIDDFDATPSFLPVGEGAQSQDPMSRLRRLIEERQSESVEILRGWMEEEAEERA